MRFSLVALMILECVVSTAPADWPQFRGPDGQGHSNVTGLPLEWSEARNVGWKVAVEGLGWSSPVVAGEQVWMTTALPILATPEEAKKWLAGIDSAVPSPEVARSVTLKAVCLDRSTGRLLRSVTLIDRDKPIQICSVNSYASPTPVIEAGRLYCDFGTMGTACLDTASGKILWQRCVPIQHRVGSGSSPIIHDDLFIIVRDGCVAQYVMALDKNTGKTVWKTNRPPIEASRPDVNKSFSTPLMIDAEGKKQGGKKQLVVMGARWLCSYEPETGKPLWRVDTGPSFSNASRPVFGHGLIFICTAYGGSELLAVRVNGRGDVTDTHVAWKTNKQTPKMSSPLLLGDEIYFVSDGGVANCLDARTGEKRWTERIMGKCSASPTFADGRIYFCDEAGKTVVVQPGKEFVRLAENQLEGQVKASVAVADRAIFLRTATHLYRIEKQQER